VVPGWLRHYRASWLRGDLVAGLTVWAVLVPESLAYATIAGVPPVVGLYAAVPSLVLYALVGSSRHLVVGPMSATAALSAGIVAGLLRLGFLASFISEPVLKGFIVGLALTIIAGQLPKLFGVEKGGGDFFRSSATSPASSATPAARPSRSVWCASPSSSA
jgi:sulfate permease, SulP family